MYLDHAATSPLRPEAHAAMEEGFALWANPSSPHAEGRKARSALEDARERIKAALGWDGEVIFTSGASESAERVFDYTDVLFKFASAIEHDAVHHHSEYSECEEVPVLDGGMVDLIWLQQKLAPAKHDHFQPARSLVALQQVNSETGTIQQTVNAYALTQERGGFLLADCSQSVGKLPLPECDMAIFSAHKFGGPIGVGALLVKDFNMLKASGGHERGYRRGTENLPGALGMAAALEAADWQTSSQERAKFAKRLVDDRLAIGNCVDHIIALTHPTLSAQALLIRLDAMGFAVSAGSACSSGTLKKSRVLDAFGVPDDVASRTIRV
ncbi:MAG: aminotransferase class V-fold PLP-dependent enzyme, partial [Pseudomonadota bacterium]